jgi:hypothetical protein
VTPGAPDLDAYRAGVERHLAAPSDDPGGLFEADAVRGLAAAAAADPALRPLARFAAEGHLRRASARETGTAERLIREPLVGDPRDGVPPAAVDALLADEPDAGRRRELHTARLRAMAAHVREPLADAGARRDEAARALGAASATALVADAAGVDTAAAAAGAALLLEATDDLAARGLARIAGAALGRDARRLSAADLPRVVSAPQLADALPTAAAGPAAARTGDLLGMPRGAPPASDAVRLAAVAHALRATGAALAREGASRRLPVEARELADPALAAAAGRLLEGLVAEPAWLARVAGVADPDGAARTAGVVRLLGARAAAARAVALGTADPDGLGRALGVGWPAELTLADPLAGLAPLDDLRARALAAALRVHLRETFGERWFAEPAAGAFLRELWLEGGRLDADALARELGAPGADAALVAHEAAATAA